MGGSTIGLAGRWGSTAVVLWGHDLWIDGEDCVGIVLCIGSVRL